MTLTGLNHQEPKQRGVFYLSVLDGRIPQVTRYS